MAGWHDQLMANIERGDVRTFNDAKWEPDSWPRHSRGIGTIEGPRGALAHWIIIDDGVITNYQAVVPTTWNAGPMDERGQHGPYEAASAGPAPSGHPRPAARGPAHHPQLRSVHGLRRACLRTAREEVVRVKIR
jgi:Ni,Fe-hydrogenase I large subunit